MSLNSVFGENRWRRCLQGKPYRPVLKPTLESHPGLLTLKYVPSPAGGYGLIEAAIRDENGALLAKETIQSAKLEFALHYWGEPYRTTYLTFSFKDYKTISVVILAGERVGCFEMDHYDLRLWLNAQSGIDLVDRERFEQHKLEQELQQRQPDQASLF